MIAEINAIDVTIGKFETLLASIIAAYTAMGTPPDPAISFEGGTYNPDGSYNTSGGSGSGSGGGGVNIADYLMEDWVDDRGVAHRGLIDKEYSADYISKYPNAIDKVKLMSPSQYKSMMCEALIEMMNMDLISFTSDYDNKGYLTIFETDEKQLNKAKKEIELQY